MTENKVLKPCPFCGSKDLSIIYLDEDGYLREHYDGLAEYACIRCENCSLTMREQIVFEKDTKVLIRRWNKRNEFIGLNEMNQQAVEKLGKVGHVCRPP